MTEKYPEVLRVGENRVRSLFGGRHNHCYTSPVYRNKVSVINKALAERFAANPAILLWHISNEYGGECHCPLCQEAFRSWLKVRYKNLEELNCRWSTMFWSHTYQSFEQIESPSSIGEYALHALTLEWKRFVTDQTADFAKAEISVLKKVGIKQPVSVNLMYNYQGINYDKLAECVDIISWDSYPLWHKTEDILIARDNGLQHDYMRCLKRRPYLLMESSPTATNWQGVSKLKKPGLLTAASLQAVAHGADSVQYFQIRQSEGGSEKFHGAVIDHYGGNDTRVFKEVKKIGEILSSLGEIQGSDVKAEVAVIYDVENQWAIKDSQGPRNKGMYYHEAVMKSYQALKKSGLNVDVISEEQDISGYKLVVGPMLYMLREGMEDKIRKFVAAGGYFITTYWTGIVDSTDRCFLGGTPYQLMDVFGVRRTETDGLYDGEENLLIPSKTSMLPADYICRNVCDLLELRTAEPLFFYGRDFYKGTSAVTQNRYGKGMAYYIGADADQKFYDEFLRLLVKEADVSTLVNGTIPEEIEISSRSSADAEFLFVQNYCDKAVDISMLELRGIRLLGEDEQTLEAYGTLLLKR